MRDLPGGDYVITTTTGPRTISALRVTVDEFGYWFGGDTSTPLLHVAHGALLSIEPAAPDITTTAQTAREKLHARAGR